MNPEVYPDTKKSWVDLSLSQWIQFYIRIAYFFRIYFNIIFTHMDPAHYADFFLYEYMESSIRMRTKFLLDLY